MNATEPRRPRRSHADLLLALSEHREALSDSAAAYDAGKRWEARRLATAVYTLVHDGNGRSVSLLSQLKVRRKLPYLSTARPLKGNIPRVALVMFQIQQGEPTYVPRCALAEPPPWTRPVSFDEWWETEAIFATPDGQTFSRKNLVFSMRTQDGGAHFDERWENALYRVMATATDERVRRSGGGLNISVGATPPEGQPIPDAHLASMRQVAWELLTALKALSSDGCVLP